MRHCTIALGLLLPLLAGCGEEGPPMGTVEGKVTIGGSAPPEPIIVNYINTTIGQGGGARTEADGSYELEFPVMVGEYTIYFSKIVESSGPVSTADEQLKTIPPEYGNEMSSPLKKSVKEGENTIDLELPKAG